MSAFAIIVTVKLKPGAADAFRPLILTNAEAAVRDEPTCQQFQVTGTEDDPETFIFYGVHDDAAALDSHRAQPHLEATVVATKDLIAERTVRHCTVIKT